jgi:hypothetical protein
MMIVSGPPFPQIDVKRATQMVERKRSKTYPVIAIQLSPNLARYFLSLSASF